MSAKSECVSTNSSATNPGWTHPECSGTTAHRALRGRRIARSIWKMAFLALLFTGSAYATDPVDVDPDPDTDPPPTQLVVDDLSQVNPQSLAPGRYVILLKIEEGLDEVHELVVE